MDISPGVYHPTHYSNVSRKEVLYSFSSSRDSGVPPPCWVTVYYSSNHCGPEKALSTLAGLGHTRAGRGRWDEPHLKHMVETKEKGQFLKLHWDALKEQEEKAAEQDEPHRCPLHT